MKARELTSLQRPSDRDVRSVRRWVHGTKPLVADEEEFIHCKEDLITLRSGRECAGFDGFMEGLLQKTNCNLIKVSCALPRHLGLLTDERKQYIFRSRVLYLRCYNSYIALTFAKGSKDDRREHLIFRSKKSRHPSLRNHHAIHHRFTCATNSGHVSPEQRKLPSRHLHCNRSADRLHALVLRSHVHANQSPSSRDLRRVRSVSGLF